MDVKERKKRKRKKRRKEKKKEKITDLSDPLGFQTRTYATLATHYVHALFYSFFQVAVPTYSLDSTDRRTSNLIYRCPLQDSKRAVVPNIFAKVFLQFSISTWIFYINAILKIIDQNFSIANYNCKLDKSRSRNILDKIKIRI